MRKGGSNLSLSALRKELREGNLESFLGGSSTSHTEPDPLLTSFIYNPSVVDEPHIIQPLSSIEDRSIEKCSVEDLTERVEQQAPLSDEDLKEKAKKSEFVQGLLLSTFLDDNL
ncbi:hypothetical protein RD792_016870 [Penstemon davidsonii]|uniref:Di19 C-terminal domain-containing protein n=1 Tax=Penstemon davidsonii TaxID=160366 RepID=A0ABR0CLC1_9LAMI|nr:hypothetical protein RD792_016870 [Penstemon davidsonii]